jgi:hypothetical protein
MARRSGGSPDALKRDAGGPEAGPNGRRTRGEEQLWPLGGLRALLGHRPSARKWAGTPLFSIAG